MPSTHGAGVFIHDGEGRVLLGKRKDGWTTFSGRAENEETPLETATRECAEETLSTLKDVVNASTIEQCTDSKLPLVTLTPGGRAFYLYIVRIGYDATLPTRFSRNRRSSAYEDRRECMEMSRVGWFAISELQNVRLRASLSADLADILQRVRESGDSGDSGDATKK